MAMIFRTADLDGFEIVITRDAGDVGPEFGLDVLAQAFLSLPGAEDHMDPIARISVRHGSSLPGLQFKFGRYPALKRTGLIWLVPAGLGRGKSLLLRTTNRSGRERGCVSPERFSGYICEVVESVMPITAILVSFECSLNFLACS